MEIQSDAGLRYRFKEKVGTLEQNFYKEFDNMHTHFVAWLANRHSIRKQLVTKHLPQKTAELDAKHKKDLARIMEIKQQAQRIKMNEAFLRINNPISENFNHLRPFCTETLAQMRSAAIEIDRAEIQLIRAKIVPKEHAFINDPQPLTPVFTERDLQTDVTAIDGQIAETFDRNIRNNELIQEIFNTIAPKLQKNFVIFKANIKQALDVIAAKQQLCRPFLCTSEDYEAFQRKLAATVADVQDQLTNFVPNNYSIRSLNRTPAISQVRQFILDRYKQIYRTLMENERNVERLIKLDFDLFQVQRRMREADLTQRYDVLTKSDVTEK